MSEIIPFNAADMRASVRAAVVGLYQYDNAAKALAWLRAMENENAKLREVLTYVDRQVREVWTPPPGNTYQSVHRAWCIEQAAKALERPT